MAWQWQIFLSTLAPLNQFLFDHFGWRGSFLVGVMLNRCMAGSLTRPIKIKTKPLIRTKQENWTSLLSWTNRLAPYAKHQGINEYSAAFLLSIFALVDTFARPGMGLIAKSRWIRPKIQYLFSFAGCLEKEQKQRKVEGLEIGSAKELAVNEDKDSEEEIKLSTEEVGNSTCKEL